MRGSGEGTGEGAGRAVSLRTRLSSASAHLICMRLHGDNGSYEKPVRHFDVQVKTIDSGYCLPKLTALYNAMDD